MKNKSNGGVWIGILIGIIIMLLVFVGLFVTGSINYKETIISDNKQISDNNQSIDSNISDEENNNEEDIIGIYNKESKNEYSYYKSTVNITDYTDSTISFNISTVHGKDEENVNIGEVKGIAKKIKENEYEFEENIEGNISRITFKFSNKGTYQYLTINESYSNNVNPYGGHGVYFASEYEKEK